jgi:DNA-binding NtrC family response regulator
MTKVVVVDDEAGIRESLCCALQRDGFEAVQLDRLANVEAELTNAALLVLSWRAWSSICWQSSDPTVLGSIARQTRELILQLNAQARA